MSKLSLAVASLAAIFVAPTLTNAALLLNGDFNTDTGSTTPVSWSNWSYGDGWSNYQTSASGNFATYTKDGSNFVNAGSTWNGGGGWYQTVAATAGQAYTLSADSSTETWDNSIGYMRLIFLDSTGATISGGETDLTVSNYDKRTWATYTINNVTAPAGTAQVKVEFASYGGTTNFDNAVLTAVPEPASLGLVAVGVLGALRRRR